MVNDTNLDDLNNLENLNNFEGLDDLEDLDMDWEDYCDNSSQYMEKANLKNESKILQEREDNLNKDLKLPKCSDIYISTKTIISYLNCNNIDLNDVFWKLKIQPYYLPNEGIIKKQMKFNSTCIEELNYIKNKLDEETHYKDDYIINQIINPDGRIKFKDIRKISIGLCKKDITSYRCKKKSAFYNCFVIILRILYNNSYKEIHVKVFNTGKLEIPGIQNDEVLHKVLDIVKNILTPLIDLNYNLDYLKKSETVLINSNFNCGFYINRDKLYESLKYKYNINSVYDPCSYPGIQSEFYYNKDNVIQTGKQVEKTNNIVKVSFMIFRTGSVLIVGKCTEEILYNIYNFLKKLLEDEYKKYGGELINKSYFESKKLQNSKKKIRKKIIITDIN
tara:strand:+ start:12417 stop:13589 length:1173 start_codon:yes stop_codon:yes gene_type:complete